jgi:hypothetical protein
MCVSIGVTLRWLFLRHSLRGGVLCESPPMSQPASPGRQPRALRGWPHMCLSGSTAARWWYKRTSRHVFMATGCGTRCWTYVAVS